MKVILAFSFQFLENRAKMLRLRTRNKYVMVKSAKTCAKVSTSFTNDGMENATHIKQQHRADDSDIPPPMSEAYVEIRPDELVSRPRYAELTPARCIGVG